MMKKSNTTFPGQFASHEMADEAVQVLGWINDLVTAGIAKFDDRADEFPCLHLFSGEVFVLGNSSITRVR
jgi:hypothetical protein